MDYYRKKFKNKSAQDIASALLEKEYKLASLQAISNQTILENNEKSLKELLEEVNGHLTDLRGLLEEKETHDKTKCEKLILQFEECLVKLVNKNEDQKQIIRSSDKNPGSQKVGKIEIEEKLKQMRQKRLNRQSAFVNEQVKLSEERSQLTSIPSEEKLGESENIPENLKLEANSEKTDMFQRSTGRVADLRSSFGKGLNFGNNKKEVSESATTKQIGPKSPRIQVKQKNLDSPKSPTQKRNFFSSINCLTEESKQDTDKIIEDNDKMMNEIKHIQLKKVNASHNADVKKNQPNKGETSAFLEQPESIEIRKPRSPNFHRWNTSLNRLSDISGSKEDNTKGFPKKAIAVAPPKVNFTPFNVRSKSDLHESWKSKKESSPVDKNNTLKPTLKTASKVNLEPNHENHAETISSFKRASTERCSFSTFRTSKDSFTTEENLEVNVKTKNNDLKRRTVYTTIDFSNKNPNKLVPKKERINYETIDLKKTLEYNKNINEINNKTESIQENQKLTIAVENVPAKRNSDAEKCLKDLLNSCKTIEESFKNKKHSEVFNIIGSSECELSVINELLIKLKTNIEKNEQETPSQILPLFSPYREELSKLEKQVNSFKGLRRDLEYLYLSSHISKVYIDVKNIECHSKEHEKRRHSFLEKVNALENELETKLDRNEEVLMRILEEQAQIIGDNIKN